MNLNEKLSKVKVKKGKANYTQWLLKRLSSTKEKMAKYAYGNTAFYKKLYGDLFEKRSIPFEALPPVKKEVVNDASPFDLLSDELKNEVFKYAETTGSTGSPTPSFYTKKEFRGSILLSKLTPYSMLLKDVLKKNRRAVCGLACGFTIAGPSFQQVLDNFGFMTINVDARTTIAPPHRVARLLSRYKPSVIVASETDFLSWMKVVKELYPRDYSDVVKNLEVLMSTAELCSENRSREIEKEFDIIHIDNYACVEGYFSLPCLCGEKHILPVYHTEVLSDDLKTTSEYGTGRFAFTNLLRKSTPFVRYLLDDLVTIYHSKCPFGYTKSIIPHGRYELTVKINGKRYGTRDFENILFKKYLFGEYNVQIINDKIKIYAEDYIEKEIPLDEIMHDFENKFGLHTYIEIVPYGTIRDYHEIRKSKPLLRLVDNRLSSTQRVPQYL